MKITVDQIENLAKYVDWKWKKKKIYGSEFICRSGGHTITVYANDLDILKSVESHVNDTDFVYYSAELTIPIGVKYFKNEPKHKFRVYLKSRNITKEKKEEIARIITRYQGSNTFSPCRALNDWLFLNNNKWNMLLTQASYFFDYDEESTLTLLAFLLGDLLSKNYKLEKQPK